MTGLCRELLDRVEPICAEQGIVLRWELPDHPIPCRVDPALLRRMLCNLLSNAVKAQPAGGSIDVMLKEGGLVDVAIIYALISFLSVVIFTKVFTGVYQENREKAEALLSGREKVKTDRKADAPDAETESGKEKEAEA